MFLQFQVKFLSLQLKMLVEIKLFEGDKKFDIVLLSYVVITYLK